MDRRPGALGSMILAFWGRDALACDLRIYLFRSVLPVLISGEDLLPRSSPAAVAIANFGNFGDFGNCPPSLCLSFGRQTEIRVKRMFFPSNFGGGWKSKFLFFNYQLTKLPHLPNAPYPSPSVHPISPNLTQCHPKLSSGSQPQNSKTRPRGRVQFQVWHRHSYLC